MKNYPALRLDSHLLNGYLLEIDCLINALQLINAPPNQDRQNLTMNHLCALETLEKRQVAFPVTDVLPQGFGNLYWQQLMANGPFAR